jgi:hypothetical protein
LSTSETIGLCSLIKCVNVAAEVCYAQYLAEHKQDS